MSNVSIQENQGVIGTLTEVIGKVAFFPIEVVKFGAGLALNLIAFVGTTSINLADNVLKGVSSVLEGVQTVITPRK